MALLSNENWVNFDAVNSSTTMNIMCALVGSMAMIILPILIWILCACCGKEKEDDAKGKLQQADEKSPTDAAGNEAQLNSDREKDDSHKRGAARPLQPPVEVVVEPKVGDEVIGSPRCKSENESKSDPGLSPPPDLRFDQGTLSRDYDNSAYCRLGPKTETVADAKSKLASERTQSALLTLKTLLSAKSSPIQVRSVRQTTSKLQSVKTPSKISIDQKVSIKESAANAVCPVTKTTKDRRSMEKKTRRRSPQFGSTLPAKMAIESPKVMGRKSKSASK